MPSYPAPIVTSEPPTCGVAYPPDPQRKCQGQPGHAGRHRHHGTHTSVWWDTDSVTSVSDAAA